MSDGVGRPPRSTGPERTGRSAWSVAGLERIRASLVEIHLAYPPATKAIRQAVVFYKNYCFVLLPHAEPISLVPFA